MLFHEQIYSISFSSRKRFETLFSILCVMTGLTVVWAGAEHVCACVDRPGLAAPGVRSQSQPLPPPLSPARTSVRRKHPPQHSRTSYF